MVGAAIGGGYKTPVGPIELNLNWSNITKNSELSSISVICSEVFSRQPYHYIIKSRTFASDFLETLKIRC